MRTLYINEIFGAIDTEQPIKDVAEAIKKVLKDLGFAEMAVDLREMFR